MSRCYKFAIIRLCAHPLRDERLNVGIVVFYDDNLDVHVTKRLDKIRAISSDLNVDAVRKSILGLAAIDEYLRVDGRINPEDRLAELRNLTSLDFSDLGVFHAHSSDAYEENVSRILRSLVDPEPARFKLQRKRTRLLSVVKTAFRQEGVLARKGEDLSAHRIVPHVTLAEGLAADLVLKNGAMHVIETVDAASVDGSVRKVVTDIAIAALVLEQARITFGEDGTKSKLVYDASPAMEAFAMPSLMAAAHQGTELINWASRDDRIRFIEHVSSLAVPLEKKSERVGLGISASTQNKLTLN